jgi:hypothetical protein
VPYSLGDARGFASDDELVSMARLVGGCGGEDEGWGRGGVLEVRKRQKQRERGDKGGQRGGGKVGAAALKINLVELGEQVGEMSPHETLATAARAESETVTAATRPATATRSSTRETVTAAPRSATATRPATAPAARDRWVGGGWRIT